MKKLITILSILTLGFNLFADEVELKTEELLVNEFTVTTGVANKQKYIVDNYDSVLAVYNSLVDNAGTGLIKEANLTKTSTYIAARKAMLQSLILSNPIRFITAIEGDKTVQEFMIPLSVLSTQGQSDKYKKDVKSFTNAYVKANYDNLFTLYSAQLSATEESTEGKKVAVLPNGILLNMIMSNPKAFLEKTNGTKTDKQLFAPINITGVTPDKKAKDVMAFQDIYIKANMDNIATSWTAFVAQEEIPETIPAVNLRLYKEYLKGNADALLNVSFSVATKIAPMLWIKANDISFTTLKLDEFVIDGIKLNNDIIFNLAKEAGDYECISTMNIKGLSEGSLKAYVAYMLEKITAMSDSNAYKATKTLESKLLRLNAPAAKALLKQVQSIQDVVYLRIMRDNKIK